MVGANSKEIDAIAVELGGMILPSVAPDEQDDYEAIVQAYRDQAGKSLVGDNPLAFGMGELVQLASPVVYEAAKLAAAFLLAQLGASAKRVAADVIKSGEKSAKTWIRQKMAAEKTIQVSPEQRSRLLKEIRSKLDTLKADRKLTESIIGSVSNLLSESQ